MTQQRIHHVIGGGTRVHVAPHFSFSAEAYGGAARFIHEELQKAGADSQLHLTRMADPASSRLDTPDDVASLMRDLTADPATQIVFFSPAIVDFRPAAQNVTGKYSPKFDSRSAPPQLVLAPVEKILPTIRTERKDIFLVGFKTTSGALPHEQYAAALNTLKASHANLMLANDVRTRMHMIVTPEESFYEQTTDRKAALSALVRIALARAGLTYTRSTVLEDEPRVAWDNDDIAPNLREVVDYVIAHGGYKPFRGKTAGHFAARGVEKGEFLTSARGEDFNRLDETGLVRVFAHGDDEVIAHGARPSVGGQSQRIIFDLNPQLSNIVHFHCPMAISPADDIPVRAQWMYECGSHECGQNTADGMREVVPGIHAVMLENHGPNIAFGRNVPAQRVIDFIERNFDLGGKTGYLLDPPQRAMPHGASALAAPGVQ